MSARGTFRTCQPRQPMSGFRSKQPCRRNPETAEFDPLPNSPGRRKGKTESAHHVMSRKRADDRASTAIKKGQLIAAGRAPKRCSIAPSPLNSISLDHHPCARSGRVRRCMPAGLRSLPRSALEEPRTSADWKYRAWQEFHRRAQALPRQLRWFRSERRRIRSATALYPARIFHSDYRDRSCATELSCFNQELLK
jgi:hypothetical protein